MEGKMLDIPGMTVEQIAEMHNLLLLENKMIENSWWKEILSDEKSNKLKSLSFLLTANTMKDKVIEIEKEAYDDIPDTEERKEYFRKAIKNYSEQAIKNYEAFIKYWNM